MLGRNNAVLALMIGLGVALLPAVGLASELTIRVKPDPTMYNYFVYSSCPLTGVDSSTVAAVMMNYTAFQDPLPQGSVVTSIDVQAATMPLPTSLSGYLLATLNSSRYYLTSPDQVIGQVPMPNYPTRNGGFFDCYEHFVTIPFQGPTAPGGNRAYHYGGSNFIRLDPVTTPYAIDGGCCDWPFEYVDVTLHYTGPSFAFDLTPLANADAKQARLLAHNDYHQEINPATGQPFGFFSTLQLPTNGQVGTLPNVSQSQRGPQMRVDGVVHTPPSTNRIWFKLIDPMDDAATANYVPDADRHTNDNRDNASALLWTADGSHHVGVNTPLQLSWDAADAVHLILEGSQHAAGDNYEVIASFSPPVNGTFPCEAVAPSGCDHSPVITVWKRVFVESHTMFRTGAFLAAAVDPTLPDADQILVRGDATAPPFSPGQTLRLLGGGSAQHAEDVQIVPNRVDPTTGAPLPAVEPQQNNTWLLHLTRPVRNGYFGVAPNAGNSISPIAADAVGVPGAYFVPETSAATTLYSSMYIDVEPAPPTFPDFPYVAVLPDPAVPSTNPLLPSSSEPVLAARFITSRDPDVFHVIGADGFTTTGTVSGSTASCTTNFGDTSPGSTGNYSYVYVGNIEAGTTGAIGSCAAAIPSVLGRITLSMIEATVAHELTHQFSVNHDPSYPAGKDKGHCSFDAVQPPGQPGDLCLMNQSYPSAVVNVDQIDQLRLVFHWTSNGYDSEYTQVRAHLEPVTH